MRVNPREQLLSCHRRHVRAWGERNLAMLRRLYAENAVIFSTEPPPRFADFKSFENTLHSYFSRFREFSFFTTNIRIEIDGEVGWITSEYMRAFRLEEQLVHQNGRWTEIYRCDGGRWKLVHLHSSLEPSASP